MKKAAVIGLMIMFTANAQAHWGNFEGVSLPWTAFEVSDQDSYDDRRANEDEMYGSAYETLNGNSTGAPAPDMSCVSDVMSSGSTSLQDAIGLCD